MKEVILIISGVLLIVLLILLCIAAAFLIIKICISYKTTRSCQINRRENLYDLAFKDNLTGLLNRNAYHRKIQELKKQKQSKVWILLFDIDNLKSINDTNGHLFGDEILLSAANMLRRIFASDNHGIYRIGGDEFLVVSENIEEKQVIELLLQLKEAEAQNHVFRFSKGYSKMENGETDAFENAFLDADQMLYADKNSKK